MIRKSRVLKRLRSDFQLSIITLMCLLGVIGISPYAVYRLAQGNYVVGVADVIIVLSAISTTIYAWRTGDTPTADPDRSPRGWLRVLHPF